MWRLLTIVGILVGVILLSLIPLPVDAQPPPSSSDVTITASGFVVAAPGDFTVWYISDYEVGIGWTMPAGAANVMIRKVVGRMPTSRTDGVEVYYGSGTTATDYNVNLDTYDAPVYYRAWAETATGLWEEVGASAFIEGVGMTLMILGLLGMGLTIAMFATRNSMLGFPSAIFWGILGGFSYQQSLTLWDWRYILFFGAMGMVIFSMFAAYALRKSDLAGPDADEGAFIDEGGRPYRPKGRVRVLTPRRAYQTPDSMIDEEPEGEWGDIDRLGMYDATDSRASSKRSRELRERAKRRRNIFPRPGRWGEFG